LAPVELATPRRLLSNQLRRSSQRLERQDWEWKAAVPHSPGPVQTPLRQIAENAGEDGAVISGEILDTFFVTNEA
jgi:hypothetical protein